MSNHAHPRDRRPASPGSKCWSLAHFQKKLVKSTGKLVPCGARILSQSDAGNWEAETGRDSGSKLWLFLLRLAWLLLRIVATWRSKQVSQSPLKMSHQVTYLGTKLSTAAPRGHH